MPWTPEQFRSRHNHKLSDSQANEASRVANALLRKYGDEGKAIRIANSVVQKAEGGRVDDPLSLLHALQDAARMKSNPPEPDHPALKYLDPGFCAGGSTDFKGVVDGYAGGGKVSQLVDFAIKNLHIRPDETHGPTLAMLELAKSNPYQFGTFGENSPRYQKFLEDHSFNPALHEKDLDLLDSYAQGAPHYPGAMDNDRLRWLINKYGLVLPPTMQLHRGDYTIEDSVRPGDTFPSNRARSTTIDQNLARHFADYKRDSGQAIVHNLQPGPHKVLPLPISGQNEFLIPPGPKGTIRVDSADLDSEFGNDATWYTTGKIGPGYAGGGFVEKLMAALRSKVSENEVDPAIARLRAAYADAHHNWMSAAPTGDIDTGPLSDYLKIATSHVNGGDAANALANARAALDRSQVASRSAANPLMIDRVRRKFVNQALGQLYDAHDYMNLAHSSIDPASHVPFPYPSREGADPLMTDLERAKP